MAFGTGSILMKVVDVVRVESWVLSERGGRLLFEPPRIEGVERRIGLAH